MGPEIIYASIEGSRVIIVDDKYVQVGGGIVVWGDRIPHVWENGKELTASNKFNGCFLERDHYFTTRFFGEDHQSRCWDAVLQFTQNARPTRPAVGKKDHLLELTCDQVDRILRGYPFAAIVEECLRADTDARAEQLEKEAVFAANARIALAKIYRFNESGGAGSRRAVKDLILELMSGQVHKM